ncbi:PDZ domain-containing protein [Lederbergia citrea]|uniref:PDZ domain-containing protein n=1 Tax=Lederbergia citrea TaxID=2833581 RepID=UPI001BC9040B|nr:PDZ domain-containing protein [Lederbergia citrea]MBS4205003.1 PDZ domain-containing protein [Lederbergia citrea]
MTEIWLLELAKGIGRIFLHPLLYFSMILAVIAGVLRVKRERGDFNVRVHSFLYELKNLFPAGIVAGLILSIISVSIGLTIPLIFIAAIAVISIILGSIGNARLLSPALIVGLALLVAFTANYFELRMPYFENTIESNYFIGVAILLGILILTEGILMLKNGLKDISPKLRTSSRGLTVGALQTKRLWMLPIFVFLPAGPLTVPFDWWPVIDWGTKSYSLMLVPFIIGFQQQIQSSLPEKAVTRLARQTIGLGVIVIFLSGLSFLDFPFSEFLPAAVGLIAILGRLWISYRHRVREGNTLYYFTPQNNGIMILDVLPGSPADKMGLKTGEIIQICNNINVRNKQDLFESLLKNRAYCKLEVLDTNGEKRFVQRALYEGDHHELGILFVEKRMKHGADRAV